MMHEPEKSDSVVVAVKLANKAERSAAEPAEPRTGTKGKRCAMKARKRRAAREMKEGPSKPPCRRRLQTAIRCCGQKPWC
jgi:hypothetical protein